MLLIKEEFYRNVFGNLLHISPHVKYHPIVDSEGTMCLESIENLLKEISNSTQEHAKKQESNFNRLYMVGDLSYLLMRRLGDFDILTTNTHVARYSTEPDYILTDFIKGISWNCKNMPFVTVPDLHCVVLTHGLNPLTAENINDPEQSRIWILTPEDNTKEK